MQHATPPGPIPVAPARAFRADTACRPILPPVARARISVRFPPVKSRQRRGDEQMKTDEMRQRIARQAEGDLREPFTPKISGRPGRRLTWLKTISKPSHSSSGRVKSFSPTLAPPETRSTSALSIVRSVDGCRLPILAGLKIFRQMSLRHVARKILEQAANQNRIAVADLARLGRLVRRNNFVAGGEMSDAQARADERMGVSRRRQQRQRAGVQFRAGGQQRLARPHIFAAKADIAPPISRRTMRIWSPVRSTFSCITTRRSFARQRRAGRHAHGFAGFQLARFPIGGVKRVHD